MKLNTGRAENITRNVQSEQQQQTKLHLGAAGWLLQLACRAEFLNDTSVITLAVLAVQLHLGMLYLVDFTGKQSAVTFHSLTGPGCVKVRYAFNYTCENKPMTSRQWDHAIYTHHLLTILHLMLIWTMKINVERSGVIPRVFCNKRRGDDPVLFSFSGRELVI